MNHNQNDKMCHVEEHHLYQDEEMIQNDEDFLLPSVEAAEHTQDEEPNNQDEIVFLSPDCGYQSPQLSEDEAHTIHRYHSPQLSEDEAHTIHRYYSPQLSEDEAHTIHRYHSPQLSE